MPKLGILGGGQLGMYLAQAAKAMDVEVIALEPQLQCPIAPYCDTLIVGAYDDLAALESLFSSVDVVIFEFENVDTVVLNQMIAKYPTKVLGNIQALITAQARLDEKEAMQRIGLPTAAFVAWNDTLEPTLPCIIKTNRMGYDGKGQFVCRNQVDVEEFKKAKMDVDYIVEGMIDFDLELSVCVIRGLEDCIVYEPMENIHSNGILDLTLFPARISSTLASKAKALAITMMEALDFYGIVTVELFAKGDTLYVNELAPRPHNSGHITMQACDVSIYENAVRAVLGWQLKQPQCKVPGVMLNVLGQHKAQIDELQDNYYDYGKQLAKTNRKMGHFVFLDHDIEAALNTAKQQKQRMEKPNE
ncbi:MAG: 5-(carboxyamino)imidazole ribonucleotide synthase [Erysipelotrichaceae bacterium]